MDQNLLNGQDDSSKVEAPLSSPPQVAELHKPQCAEIHRDFCNSKSVGRFVSALLFCVVCAIIAMYFARGNLIVAWLLAAGVPFIAFSVYASEIFGGTSVDKGLTFLVIVLHTILWAFLMFVIVPFVRDPILREIAKIDQGPLCLKQGEDTFGLKPLQGNVTIAKEEYYNPCWGYGLAIGFGGAVPEEILKMLTIAVFMRRGWIADPFAVLVYSFVTGATFGFIENLSYVSVALKKPGVAAIMGVSLRSFEVQTLMHPAYTIISGCLLAQRKFLYWKSHGEISCCECVGPRPTWLLVLPAIYFHFINNFLAGMMPTEGDVLITILVLLKYINRTMTLVCACYLFLTLKNVPRVNVIDLEKAGDLPTAVSYICCCGCWRSNTRDRRYESVLNMINLESGDQDGYLPPVVADEYLAPDADEYLALS